MPRLARWITPWLPRPLRRDRFDPGWFDPGFMLVLLLLCGIAAFHHLGDGAIFGWWDTRQAAQVWLVVATVFFMVAAEGMRRRRMRDLERRMAGRCHRCGYDLRASPQRCPECGAVPSSEG